MDKAPLKTGVVIYSHSGHSRRVAQKLADALNATIIELNAPEFQGLFGYLSAGFESLRQTCKLANQEFKTLADYDHIILCGPVWTSYPATPLRGLLRSDITLPWSVSLFLTSGGNPPATKAFKTAEADLGRKLIATASLGNKQEGTPEEDRIIDAFLKELASTHDQPKLHAL